jgi:acyl-CoA thioester hydrolase
MSARPARPNRTDFRHFTALSTRWEDNDVYGHVNNVVYYSFFDTAVNRYLIHAGVLDIEKGAVIGLVIETQCRYHEPLSFPDRLDVGIRVARIGTSSVRYEVGIFREGGETASADGHFVHVYVDRATRRPVALPEPLRAALSAIHA